LKAVILAAGQGTRLRPLTDDRPKCLVEIAGKTILDHQLEILRAAGVDDITVVAGYREDQIQRPGLRKIINPRYAETNMVYTLFCAHELMDGREDLIISYGDIVYEPKVLQTLLDCSAPVCLTIDKEWRRYWELRMDNPLEDAETLKLDGNRILELGEKTDRYDNIQGQYMGLIKVRADHALKIYSIWQGMDRNATYLGKDFDNMFMTGFLQHLINTGWNVRAAFVENGWLEIDSVEDMQLPDNGLWIPSKFD
jgi:L-glutamine-phosphate cytidylyltransferase